MLAACCQIQRQGIVAKIYKFLELLAVIEILSSTNMSEFGALGRFIRRKKMSKLSEPFI